MGNKLGGGLKKDVGIGGKLSGKILDKGKSAEERESREERERRNGV